MREKFRKGTESRARKETVIDSSIWALADRLTFRDGAIIWLTRVTGFRRRAERMLNLSGGQLLDGYPQLDAIVRSVNQILLR